MDPRETLYENVQYGQKGISHKSTSNYKKMFDEIQIGETFLSMINYIYSSTQKPASYLMEKHEMHFYYNKGQYKDAHYLSNDLTFY